jgi:hypothetical protein
MQSPAVVTVSSLRLIQFCDTLLLIMTKNDHIFRQCAMWNATDASKLTAHTQTKYSGYGLGWHKENYNKGQNFLCISDRLTAIISP